MAHGDQQAFDLPPDVGGKTPPQPQEDKAGMRTISPANEFAEILVLRDQDPLLIQGMAQGGFVIRSSRDVGHGNRVMADFDKPACQAGAEVFIDEEPQAERCSGRGITSSDPASCEP